MCGFSPQKAQRNLSRAVNTAKAYSPTRKRGVNRTYNQSREYGDRNIPICRRIHGSDYTYHQPHAHAWGYMLSPYSRLNLTLEIRLRHPPSWMLFLSYQGLRPWANPGLQ